MHINDDLRPVHRAAVEMSVDPLADPATWSDTTGSAPFVVYGVQSDGPAPTLP